MKQAKRLANQIKQNQELIGNTLNRFLINDYSKKVKADLRDLKEYCKFRDLDYVQICMDANIEG